MWALAAIIPVILCCVLITGVVSLVAFVGLGNKKKPNDIVHDDERSQESLPQSNELEQEKL